MTLPLPAKPTALHHTGFLVHDLEATARSLSASLGVGPWAVFTIRPQSGRVHGRAQNFSFRVALASVGGNHFELVTPVSGPSVLDEFLAAHGPGCHHTCLVYATLAEMRAAKERLLAEGRVAIQEAFGGEGFEFAYFDFPEIGSAVEVLFLDPTSLGAPDATI